MIKIFFLSILFILNILNTANATLISKYFDYEENSSLTNINLNGNIDNIINVVNGGLDNTNIDVNNGFRLFEVLGTTPAAGQQGRIIYNITENSLNFDTGSVFNKSPIYTGTAVQGDLLYYGSGTSFALLTAGTKGQALTTGGSSANPTYEGMTTQGDIEYHNGTTRTRLAPGTSGQFLKTQGTGANPTWSIDTNTSNVIFIWNGVDTATTNIDGMYVGTAAQPDISATANNNVMLGVYNSTYQTVLTGKFVKIAGISTVTIHAKMWCITTNTATLSVDVGGQSNTVTVTSETPAWATTSTIDVSGLTNGTVYDITIQLKSSAANSVYCSAVMLTGS